MLELVAARTADRRTAETPDVDEAMTPDRTRVPQPGRLLWVNQFAAAPDQPGGTRHFDIGRELVRAGWTVRLAASDLNLHAREYTRRSGGADHRALVETIDGVEFHWLWARPYKGNDWRRALNWYSFMRSVQRMPAALAADVVIGSSPQLLAALAAERLARTWRVPFLFEVRDRWPESLTAVTGRRGPAYQVLAAVAGYLYRRAHRIIVLARGVQDHLAERGIPRERLVYLPNGANLGEARPPAVGRERLTLVYAGAHGPANGLDVVLDAAALLSSESRIRFLLVGDGPSKPGLVARAAELGLGNVEFRKPVPKADIPDLLAEADAGLMVLGPADLFSYGVSPNKLFDYLAAGLPVVCNVPGEVASMLAESGAGEQARASTPTALAGAIRALLEQPPSKRAEMGRLGRAWVARERGRPMLAARLASVLDAVRLAHA